MGFSGTMKDIVEYRPMQRHEIDNLVDQIIPNENKNYSRFLFWQLIILKVVLCLMSVWSCVQYPFWYLSMKK